MIFPVSDDEDWEAVSKLTKPIFLMRACGTVAQDLSVSINLLAV